MKFSISSNKIKISNIKKYNINKRCKIRQYSLKNKFNNYRI